MDTASYEAKIDLSNAEKRCAGGKSSKPDDVNCSRIGEKAGNRPAFVFI
jgi:hypothetical protein